MYWNVVDAIFKMISRLFAQIIQLIIQYRVPGCSYYNLYHIMCTPRSSHFQLWKCCRLCLFCVSKVDKLCVVERFGRCKGPIELITVCTTPPDLINPTDEQQKPEIFPRDCLQLSISWLSLRPDNLWQSSFIFIINASSSLSLLEMLIERMIIREDLF